MPAILFLLLISVILGMSSTNAKNEDLYIKGQARSMALQMVWYHSQAMKSCPTPASCPDGEVVVTADQGSDVRVNNRNFISVINTNYIVTTFRQNIGANQTDKVMLGRINSALKDVTNNSLYAGPFDTATGNVYGNTAIFATQSVHGKPVPLYAPQTSVNTIPSTVGGYLLQNGYPVIITKVF